MTDVAAPDLERTLEQHRSELTGYCYRMLGSSFEAEDAVQETLVRAWRGFDRFEGRSALRSWLYRIATNVCLDMIQGRQRRALPMDLVSSSSGDSEAGPRLPESKWIQPIPDGRALQPTEDPAEVTESRETIRVAFIAALQHLPARQRAVLILRDVLRWKASEVAEALETSVAAVNSALQRAHAQLHGKQLTEDTVSNDLTPDQEKLLERYVDAFWRKDITTIVSMLTQEAVWEMPPFTGWYRGAENIGELIDTQCPGGVNDMPMVATWANGQPAFGLYMRTRKGDFVPFHLQVLTLDGDRVSHVGAFFDPRLFETFGLPARLPGDYVTTG